MSAAADVKRTPASGPAKPAAQAFSRVMAYVADDITRQTILHVAAETGWRKPLIEGGGIGNAIEQLTGGHSPDLLIVDLSASQNALADMNNLADVCDPDTRVIALGTANDVKLYRGLIAAGVVDYLVKPVSAADIIRAVGEAAGVGTDSKAQRHGKLVVVTGARGGCGVSTLATSLAWMSAEKFGARTALFDLDLRFGTSALTFDAEPGTGVTEMLADPDRIDPLFLERASIAATDRLSLFATEAPLAATPPLRPDAVQVLAEELLRTYDWVVADVPRDVLAGQIDLLAVADVAIMVTDLSLAAMRDALRLHTVIAEHGPQARLRLVASETRPAAKSDLPKAEFERSVGLTFAAHIPLDRKGIGECEGRGRPIAAGRGSAAAAIGKLGNALFTPEERAARKSGWGISLFKGRP